MNDQSDTKPEEKNSSNPPPEEKEAPATTESGGKSSFNKLIFVALAVFALGLVATFLIARPGDDGGETAQTGETASTAETSDQSTAEDGAEQLVSSTSTLDPNRCRGDLVEVGALDDRYVEWENRADFACYTNFERWLYFHADWCPKCVALDADIESNLDNIPEGLVIFKVDFDKEEELKRDYGVRFQTTVLRVDAQAEPDREWIGATEGHTLDELLEIFR